MSGLKSSECGSFQSDVVFENSALLPVQEAYRVTARVCLTLWHDTSCDCPKSAGRASGEQLRSGKSRGRLRLKAAYGVNSRVGNVLGFISVAEQVPEAGAPCS